MYISFMIEKALPTCKPLEKEFATDIISGSQFAIRGLLILQNVIFCSLTMHLYLCLIRVRGRQQRGQPTRCEALPWAYRVVYEVLARRPESSSAHLPIWTLVGARHRACVPVPAILRRDEKSVLV